MRALPPQPGDHEDALPAGEPGDPPALCGDEALGQRLAQLRLQRHPVRLVALEQGAVVALEGLVGLVGLEGEAGVVHQRPVFARLVLAGRAELLSSAPGNANTTTLARLSS